MTTAPRKRSNRAKVHARASFRQLRGKTSLAFDDLGERSLKNIDRPVRLYAVRSASSKFLWLRCNDLIFYCWQGDGRDSGLSASAGDMAVASVPKVEILGPALSSRPSEWRLRVKTGRTQHEQISYVRCQQLGQQTPLSP